MMKYITESTQKSHVKVLIFMLSECLQLYPKIWLLHVYMLHVDCSTCTSPILYLFT